MSGYKLRSDETKILTCTQARRCGDDREQACVELTLTNRNLIYVEDGDTNIQIKKAWCQCV